MNKQDQFIAWLCGDPVEFPFFKDLPHVGKVEMSEPSPFPAGFDPDDDEEEMAPSDHEQYISAND